MTIEPCPDHHPVAARERPMHTLSHAEIFVVAVARAWVAPHMRPDETHPDWRVLCRRVGIGEAGMAGFSTMMSVVGHHAQRLLDVRCCRCPSLGADEALMLRLFGALQAGDSLGALDVLSDWLPPGTVVPALRGAHGFAAHASMVGVDLPAPAEPLARRPDAPLH
jgi:hypothetical protein